MKGLFEKALILVVFSLLLSPKISAQCFIPTLYENPPISENEHLISWVPISFAIGYSVIYREVNNDQEWGEIYGLTTNSITLTDLFPCTNYEFQVRMICEMDSSDWSNVGTFQTLGCGNCHSGNYCITEGMINNGGSDIMQVVVNTIDNNTGNAEDGWDYTHLSTTLETGSFFTISVRGSSEWNDWVSFFIDWNQDGDFVDPAEGAISIGQSNGALLIGPLQMVPLSAAIGCTRLRVKSDYSSTSVCGNDPFGSVEDYCLCITPGIPTSIEENSNNNISIFPNPASEVLNINLDPSIVDSNEKTTLLLYNTTGQIVFTNSFESHNTSLSLKSLPNGYYLAVIWRQNNLLLRKPVIISK